MGHIIGRERVEEGFSVVCSQLLLHPSKSFHGSQGMDSEGSSLRMGPDSLGSQASFSAMAEKIRSSEYAASSPGPDRTGIFSQTCATCEPRQQPRSCSVMKLEKALEVMGDADGPAVECLKGELEKARNAAKRRPPRSV